MMVLSSASMPSTQGYMRLDVGTSSCFATVGLGSRVRLSVSLSGDLGFENTKTSLANGELLESSHIDVLGSSAKLTAEWLEAGRHTQRGPLNPELLHRHDKRPSPDPENNKLLTGDSGLM